MPRITLAPTPSMANLEFLLLAVDAAAVAPEALAATAAADVPGTEFDEICVCCCCCCTDPVVEDGSLQEAIFRRKFNFKVFI